MKIYLEENKKFGHGYQLRMTDVDDNGNDTEDIIDSRPYDKNQAAKMIRKMLEIYNRDYGTEIKPEDCIIDGTGK